MPGELLVGFPTVTHRRFGDETDLLSSSDRVESLADSIIGGLPNPDDGNSTISVMQHVLTKYPRYYLTVAGQLAKIGEIVEAAVLGESS